MSLRFHYHPLASFCWKPLIALYEHKVSFEPVLVDLGDEASRAAFFKLWPIGKMPVLEDTANGAVVPESTIVIEYVDTHHASAGVKLIPADAKAALDARLKDRFFDNYLQVPMQKVVGDRLRPKDGWDPVGVAEARAQIDAALAVLDREIAGKTWSLGDAFTLADCSAAPALFYCNEVAPFAQTHPGAFAYLERLKARPSFARVLREAEPYFANFPRQNLN